MEKNPFNLSFGRIPPEYIARHQETDFVTETFTQPPVTEQTFIVMGVRGSGKTVTMTAIGQGIASLPDWTVIKISPMEDILDSLLKNLWHNQTINQWCVSAKLELSLPGLHLSLEAAQRSESTVSAIDQILSVMQGHGQNLLVLIDEITNTPQMRAFSSALQLYITNEQPIYFVGTSLFEEMEALRNVRNLTFLYRAPKINLSPLDRIAIMKKYQSVFDISKETALQMAAFTKGYSYAFQVLGYYCWKYSDRKFPDREIIEAFDIQLAEASYNKLWSDLSPNDQKVMRAIAEHEGGKTKEIYQAAGMDSNNFNQYRRRLKRQGLIDVSQYGKISFSLPRMANYIREYTF